MLFQIVNLLVLYIYVELTRKNVASAFWNYEIEEELREQGWGNYCFHSVGDREKAMQKVDEKRAVTII